MSLRYSTGERNAALKTKAFRKIFEDGTLRLYTGAQPATADLGATGSLLVSITKASGVVTVKSTRQISACKVATRGNDGDTHIITVGGVIYSYTVVTGDTLDTIAQKLAALVDADPNIMAVGVGGTTVTESVVVMRSKFGGADAFVAVSSNTGVAVLSAVEDQVPTASGNGLKFGDPAAGTISKNGDVWSGVAVLAGVAGWFRISEFGDDPTQLSTTAARVDGQVGVGLGDLQMGNTSIDLASTVTIAQAAFTAISGA